MKDVINIWNRIVGSTYDAVQTQARFRCENHDQNQNRCSGSRKSKHSSAITISVLGFFSICTAIFIYLVNPYELIFNYKTVFGDGGEMFELWRKPPVDLYLRVFLWNVTNKEEYMSGKDTKLKIKEVGPYVYKELMLHDNVTFNDNGTLTAIPRHPLQWVPELSEGRQEDDILILPNIALLSIAHVVSDESYFTRLGLNMLIRQTASEPLLAMTAKEFMFGYSSTLMTLGNKFMPSWIYFDKLGLIDRMYDFEGDYETIFTGETEPSKAGLLDTFHGSTKIPQWDNPCGNINGASDGTKFPSHIQPNDTLFFYRKSMCRSKYLTKVNETTVDGLKAYVYNFKNNSDDNGLHNDENKCFCKDPENCLPPGLLDVHGCYYGFPIALSNAHFWNNDESLAAKVVGHKPDENLHKSYFVVEPISGVPIELRASFQINMALKNIKTIANCELFSEMVLPLLWAEFRLYGLPDFLAARIKLYINMLPCIVDFLMYSSLVSGFFLICLAIHKFAKSRKAKNNNKNSPWLQDDLHYIERKLSSYIPEKGGNISAKELEVYFSSLVTPLNQNIICCDDYTDHREEV